MDDAGEDFGERRLLQILDARRHDEPEALVRQVIDAVTRFCGDTAPFDDMAVLVARYDG